MADNTTAAQGRKVSKKALTKSFHNWYYGNLTCFSQEHMQTFGYLVSMLPIVEDLYDNKDDQTQALQTYSAFFNTEPQIGSMIVGVTVGLEEARANGQPIDDDTINGIRAGLMGPLAGIGDSLIAGTLRVIGTGIAIGFAQQGSPLGAILLLLIFNIPGLLIRWFGLKFGYQYGSTFITDAAKGGLMEKVTFAVSVVGLAAIGGMVASYVSLDLSMITVGSGDFAQPISDYFDMIMPCLPQLIVFGFMYWIMGKKFKTTWVLVGTIVVCIAACWIGSMMA